MGGLAIGNRVIGARSDLLAKPLAAYGYLEVSIGLFAFCFYWIYLLGDQLFVTAAPTCLPIRLGCCCSRPA